MIDKIDKCIRCGRPLFVHDGYHTKCAGIYIDYDGSDWPVTKLLHPGAALEDVLPLPERVQHRPQINYVCELPSDIEKVVDVYVRGQYIFVECDGNKKYRVDTETNQVTRADLRRVK